MSGPHTRHLYLDGTSWLHRVPAHAKVVATVAFVVAVVVTRREALWAFGALTLALVAVAVSARLPLRVLARRLVIEVPFLVFALLLPFVARGPRTEVGPLSLSVDGLWGAWNIVAKGTLGVGASLVLAATTTMPDLVRGLERLRVPAAITAILMFMVRYVDVIVGELHRMRIAQLSRAHDPRWLWQARSVGRCAGALFVRSYERGERVHLAMQARGYTGRLPRRPGDAATLGQWSLALAAPAAAALVAAGSWWAR